jgi:hypothetical protein
MRKMENCNKSNGAGRCVPHLVVGILDGLRLPDVLDDLVLVGVVGVLLLLAPHLLAVPTLLPLQLRYCSHRRLCLQVA